MSQDPGRSFKARHDLLVSVSDIIDREWSLGETQLVVHLDKGIVIVAFRCRPSEAETIRKRLLQMQLDFTALY